MEHLVKFIKTDIKAQKVLIGITLGSILIFPFIGIAFILLGAWQLFSAAYVFSYFKDAKRKVYLIYCGFHISVMLCTGLSDFWLERQIESIFGYNAFGIFLLIWFMIIPSILAIWYLRYSIKTLENLTEGKHEFFTNKEMEEILDSGEILKLEN